MEQAKKVNEVEIYEYQTLKRQMQYLKDNYPDQSRVDKLNLPFIGAPPVLTCDNADYDKTKNDADRTGIVLSVPFFGPDKILKGTITAIIRNNLIKEMIPAANYALLNATYDYDVSSKTAGQEKASAIG